MDLKEAGNLLYQIGTTYDEMGGSHFGLVQKLTGGAGPRVHVPLAKRTFQGVHAAIKKGLIRACHDLSEGGLATAVAESAFAGGLGARINLGQVPYSYMLEPAAQAKHDALSAEHAELELHPLAAVPQATAILLFSESNSRFLVEVPQTKAAAFEELLAGVPHALIGEVIAEPRLQILGLPRPTKELPDEPSELRTTAVIDAPLNELKEAWQKPLRW
jgi:phosphoribosylformylglycinamidine synthase